MPSGFFHQACFKAGYSVERIFELTKIDPWFLHQLRELHELEEVLKKHTLATIDVACCAAPRRRGFSDVQLGHLLGTDFGAVRVHRKQAGVHTTYRLVDTCAAEFEAFTPY